MSQPGTCPECGSACTDVSIAPPRKWWTLAFFIPGAFCPLVVAMVLFYGRRTAFGWFSGDLQPGDRRLNDAWSRVGEWVSHVYWLLPPVLTIFLLILGARGARRAGGRLSIPVGVALGGAIALFAWFIGWIPLILAYWNE